jgi:riboflavin biosynthesis pyrimidine reductase
VRVDAGGGLNAALRGGLADEISVVIAPYLAAGPAGSLRMVAGADNAAALGLTGAERLREGTSGCGMPCAEGGPGTA